MPASRRLAYALYSRPLPGWAAAAVGAVAGVCLGLLVACSPEPSQAEGETGESGKALDCGAPVEPLCVEGKCWVREEGWTARAEEANRDKLEAALEAGEISPVDWLGAECYSDGAQTVCVVETECGSELLGRPLAELVWSTPGCEAEGAWDSTAVDALGCWGVFGGPMVAVQLREGL